MSGIHTHTCQFATVNIKECLPMFLKIASLSILKRKKTEAGFLSSGHILEGEDEKGFVCP